MNDDNAHRNSEKGGLANSVTMESSTRIRNPYAYRKPTVTLKDPPGSAQQTSRTSSKESAAVADSIVESASDQTSAPSVNSASNVRIERQDHTFRVCAPDTTTRIGQPPAIAVGSAATGATTIVTTASSSSTYTPYWERMPSRCLSFGSAEILTVTECLDHASLYRNRSVRVTGLVHHRSFLPGNGPADVIVQLELKDPLQRSTSTPSSSRSSSFSRGRLSNLSSIRRSTSGIPPTSTSSTTTSTKHRLSSSSVQLPGTNQKRKRPWFATATTGSASSIRRRSSLIVSTPRGTDSSNTTTPLKIEPRDQVKSSVLKVLIDPRLPQLNDITVGSFVSVIGTMIEIQLDEEDTLCPRQDDITTTTPHSTRHGNETDGASNEQSHGSIYKLEARLLQGIRKDFGADMSLFGTALMARRKATYQRYYRQIKGSIRPEEHVTGIKTANVDEYNTGPYDIFPLQGCGPPPYDKFE